MSIRPTIRTAYTSGTPATALGSSTPFRTIRSFPPSSVISIVPSGRNAMLHGLTRPFVTTTARYRLPPFPYIHGPFPRLAGCPRWAWPVVTEQITIPAANNPAERKNGKRCFTKGPLWFNGRVLPPAQRAAAAPATSASSANPKLHALGVPRGFPQRLNHLLLNDYRLKGGRLHARLKVAAAPPPSGSRS
jgi:hypothetical protein